MMTATRSFVLVAAAMATGCAQADVPPGGGGGAGATGLAAYAHRRAIELGGDTPTDLAIGFAIDHAALVSDGRALEDGSDLRIGYEGEEIDRVLDTATSWNTARTVIWFRTQGVGQHFVYYGEDAPAEVMADPSRVFDSYEGFDGTELADGWTLHEIGIGVGSATVGDGAARLTGAAGDIADTADDMVFLAQSITGDFALDISIRSVSGSLGGGSKAGGLMVRQSPLPDARFAMIGLADSPRQRLTASRPIDGDPVVAAAVDVADQFPQLFSVRRVGSAFSMAYSEDAVTWISLGDTLTVEMLDPVLVGFPLANRSAGNANLEIDYVRSREIVLPTPTVALGPEVALGAEEGPL